MKHPLLPCLFAAILPVVASFAEDTPAPAKPPGAAPKPAEAAPKPVPPPPSPYPDPTEVANVMKKSANFFRREVSFVGGYAWKWPKDMSIAYGEDRSSPTL